MATNSEFFGAQSPRDRRAAFELARGQRAAESSVVALVKQACPVGTVRPTVASAADDGWLLDGASVANADTTYPELWAVAPASWKSGSTLTVPSAADARLAGAGVVAVGVVAGSNSLTLSEAQLPSYDCVEGPSDRVFYVGVSLRVLVYVLLRQP